MRGFASALALLVVATGCQWLNETADNPAQLRSRAEMAGEAAVYIYFSANRNEVANAAKLLATVIALRDVVQDLPDAGFASLMPRVDELLEARLMGDNTAYLPPAKRLALIMLEELDRKAEADNWRQAGVVVTAVSSFLTGAERALQSYTHGSRD